MYLRRVWAGWGAPMCTGCFLYVYGLRQPRRADCDERQPQRQVILSQPSMKCMVVAAFSIQA